MSKLPKPDPIGTAPCPIAGCAEVLEVFKYRERGSRGSAFKGKFYARCPQHGRVIEAIVPASQEHVLGKGNIWAPDQKPSPAQPTREPAQRTREPIQAPARSVLHVIARLDPVPAQPTQEPAQPTQEPTQPAPTWLQGWNLWDWWPTRTPNT